MKHSIRVLLAIACMAMSYANAQTRTKLCFQTGASVQSCQDVTTANPLPTTATLSASALSVTVTNTAAVPAIVSCTNCGSGNFTGNVTVTNTANVSEVNSAAILTAVTGAIPAGTNSIGSVTVLNTLTVAAHNVSVTNVPGVTNTLGTTGGWTPLFVNNLLSTPNAIKTTAGTLGKLFCYNPNSSVAYVQVWNLTTGAVTVGTTTPLNSYGIPATQSAGFAMSTTGDEYSVAISVAATTSPSNSTAPTTALVCNASYN